MGKHAHRKVKSAAFEYINPAANRGDLPLLPRGYRQLLLPGCSVGMWKQPFTASCVKSNMARIAQMVTSLLCIVTILAVCIAPLVDLPPTSLRYQFLAMFLIGCILGLAAARPGSALKSNLFSSDLMPPGSRLMLRFSRSPLQTNSVLQR
jgi:hypothetical protein